MQQRLDNEIYHSRLTFKLADEFIINKFIRKCRNLTQT